MGQCVTLSVGNTGATVLPSEGSGGGTTISNNMGGGGEEEG